MSQIFDALHESVAEALGNRSHGLPTARDLLQVVERKNTGATSGSEPATPSASCEGLPQFPSAKVVLPEFSKFVCFNENESLAAEKFRFLATRLRHIQQKRFLKRLIITSSVAGEGKSMVAANLSHALAAGKQQVLLLEGDLRRPSLGRQLGLGRLPGVSEMLQDGSSGLNIYRLEGSELCVLLAGDVHSNPLEFMEPGKLAGLMDRISIGFDWVVIDSPPVLPLADTSMWMRLADAILLVTRPGVTSKRQLQRSFEAVEQSKLLGSVLNASTEAITNHYYYHYASRSAGPQIPTATTK
jgi:capsular exopolysaccharide synthesis family protein